MMFKFKETIEVIYRLTVYPSVPYEPPGSSYSEPKYDSQYLEVLLHLTAEKVAVACLLSLPEKVSLFRLDPGVLVTSGVPLL